MKLRLIGFLFLVGISALLTGLFSTYDPSYPSYIAAGVVILTIACYLFYDDLVLAPKRAEEQKKKAKLTEQTALEDKQKSFASLKGLDKYLRIEQEKAHEFRQSVENVRKLGFVLQSSVYQEKESDWAVHAGIANGIAGPVAGILTAADVMKDNERIRSENAERRAWGAAKNTQMQDLADQAVRNRPKFLTTMNELEKHYSADFSTSSNELFSYLMLDFPIINKDYQTGAVTVNVQWSQTDQSFCIDGALRANLYANGQYAGCAYLVFPKTGTSPDFKGELSGICARPKIIDAWYNVKIEPMNLWKLEPKNK